MNLASKNRLTPHMRDRFAGTTLFDEIARTVCLAGVLPRKELYESWEVARRTARRFKGGRVVEVCAGHALVSPLMLLLDRTLAGAVSSDVVFPASATKLREVLLARWPALARRWELREAALAETEVAADDTLIAVHACGGLTDTVIAKAIAVGCRVALLPCCHALDGSDGAFLHGWLDGPLALDAARAMRLRAAGYAVVTQTIPAQISPKNRLLLASRG